MNKLYLISLGIAVLIGGFIGWGLKPSTKCPETKVQIDTVYVDKIIKDIVYYPKIYKVEPKQPQETKKDSGKVLINIIGKTHYIAEIDTVYQDSLLTANVKYVSSVPLSENSYFDMKFKVRQKEVIKVITIEKEPSFWYKRFIPYLGVGLGYDGKDIQPEIQLGVGIRLN